MLLRTAGHFALCSLQHLTLQYGNLHLGHLYFPSPSPHTPQTTDFYLDLIGLRLNLFEATETVSIIPKHKVGLTLENGKACTNEDVSLYHSSPRKIFKSTTH